MYQQERNHRKMLAAAFAMVGKIFHRIKVSKDEGAISVALVARDVCPDMFLKFNLGQVLKTLVHI